VQDAGQVALSGVVQSVAERLAAAVDALEAAPSAEVAAAVTAFEAGGEEDEHAVLADLRCALLTLRSLLGLVPSAAGGEQVYDAVYQVLEVSWRHLGSATWALPPGRRPVASSWAARLRSRVKATAAQPALGCRGCSGLLPADRCRTRACRARRRGGR
jgi:hypothetical protein